MYRLLRLWVADPVGGTEGTYAGKIQKKVPQIRTIGTYAGKVQKKVPGVRFAGTYREKNCYYVPYNVVGGT